MVADGRIELFQMPQCCAVTDVPGNMLINLNFKALGGAPYICRNAATLKLIH